MSSLHRTKTKPTQYWYLHTLVKTKSFRHKIIVYSFLEFVNVVTRVCAFRDFLQTWIFLLWGCEGVSYWVFIYLPVIWLSHMCTLSAGLTPCLHVRSSYWDPVRNKGAFNSYKVTFQVNPLMHLASEALVWYWVQNLFWSLLRWASTYWGHHISTPPRFKFLYCYYCSVHLVFPGIITY